MSEHEMFTIGSGVECTDGACGELRRLVLDPHARTLTHLVVDPGHGHATGRLVPVELVSSAFREVRLSCLRAEFNALAYAEMTETAPDSSVDWGAVQREMGVSFGGGGPIIDLYTPPAGPRTVTRDVVPEGEEEIRSGDRVHATDGEIGQLRGLVTATADHRVTHLLLSEGHLLARKQVAIPFSAVRAVDGGVRLSLSRHEVRDLPAAGDELVG